MLTPRRVPMIQVGMNEPHYHGDSDKEHPDYGLDGHAPWEPIYVWRSGDNDPMAPSPAEVEFRDLLYDKWQIPLSKAAYLWLRRYTKPVEVHGEVGASELGMHMGIVQDHGVVAFVWPGDEHMVYAFVWLDSGKLVDGSFHLFGDGTFSLS